MKITTGRTIYENVLSFDYLNNPVSAATFDAQMFKDGSLYTGLTISETLTNAERAAFAFSWSASTYGDYQLYVKNEVTDLLYMSNVYIVVPDSEANMTVYVGL